MGTTSIPDSIVRFGAAAVAAALMSVPAHAQSSRETTETGGAAGSADARRGISDEGVSLMAASVMAAAKTGSGDAGPAWRSGFNDVADGGVAYEGLILQGLVLGGVGPVRPQRLDLAVASAPIVSRASRPDTGGGPGIVAVLDDGRRVHVD